MRDQAARLRETQRKERKETAQCDVGEPAKPFNQVEELEMNIMKLEAELRERDAEILSLYRQLNTRY